MTGFALAFVLFADLACGTWNLRWFPSGRADHNAPPQVERKTTQVAAESIRSGLARTARDGHILFFQEMRNRDVTSNLVVAIGFAGLTNQVVSEFRDFDNRLNRQQVAIVTDLPVLESYWSYWQRPHRVYPPRGYVYALVDAGADGLVACYGVHLKSDYGATTPEVTAANRLKRAVCAEQLVAHAKKLKALDGRRVTQIVIAGDFNADPFDTKRYGEERTFAILLADGFANALEGLAYPARMTQRSRNRAYGGATLDGIFYKGFASVVERRLYDFVSASDHRPVWVVFRSSRVSGR